MQVLGTVLFARIYAPAIFAPIPGRNLIRAEGHRRPADSRGALVHAVSILMDLRRPTHEKEFALDLLD